MRFLLPTGIGDATWALMKIQGVAVRHAAETIDVGLVCGKSSPIESRALDFVRRFSFINSVQMCPGYGIMNSPVFTPDGYWNYIDDGFYDFDGERWCVMVPNAPLERGIRLESWLPLIPINWEIFDSFEIADSERGFAVDLSERLGPFCVFYPGPLDGNTVQGHNRNMSWRPQDWIDLGARIQRELGLKIVVVGAPYDASYYDTLLAPNLNGASGYWVNAIGATNIGELFAITDAAQFVISYQAGVGIVATYLKTPTAIFWRQKGDSIVQDAMLSFDEGMASAWVPPKQIADGTHLPLYYGRHDVDYVMKEIAIRGWA